MCVCVCVHVCVCACMCMCVHVDKEGPSKASVCGFLSRLPKRQVTIPHCLSLVSKSGIAISKAQSCGRERKCRL